jgi:uncharacterized protein
MSPIFPQFKKLEIDDKNIIEDFVKRHPPYSDFNFLSLHSWNIDLTTQYSILNDNLVIDMKDYSSNNRLLTFIGTNELESTLDILLKHLKKIGVNDLKLIPERVIEAHPDIKLKYDITEDRDQFDYIYKIQDLINMNGKNYKSLRKHYNYFQNMYNIQTQLIDINSPEIQKLIVNLIKEWKNTKQRLSKNVDEDELLALNRFFKYGSLSNLVTLGVFNKNNLIGFSSFEIIHDNYGLGHFEKANHDYTGLTIYLRRTMAEELHKLGVEFINTEQDLGIEGLRIAKTNLKPVKFLKKYKIKI